MQETKKSRDKITIGFWITGVVCALGGLGFLLFGIFGVEKVQNQVTFPQVGEEKEQKNNQISPLTGDFLADGNLANAPTYCIQIPNGTDGARPQAGLTEAGVVFEAIAEAGITRFAAIFQNPASSVIGPIRSLRTYYLEWDTPFNCTIVHAGGSGDALTAIRNGDYRDLDENDTYMYRSNYGARSWNNLFTTSTLLAEATAGETSNVKSFSRLTPEESHNAWVKDTAVNPLDITKPAEGDTSETAAKVSEINLAFNGALNYSVVYNYDANSNTYLRSYASGLPHEVYECSSEDMGKASPEQVCNLTQVAPSVVIAMVVRESLASDNYHEDITTTGNGTAFIFQNGNVIEGTWSKATPADQIKFFDESGNEVKLAVGQTFISAVPSADNVEY